MNRNNQIANAVRTQLNSQPHNGLTHGIQKHLEGMLYE
jgi:hypothetical protein